MLDFPSSLTILEASEPVLSVQNLLVSSRSLDLLDFSLTEALQVLGTLVQDTSSENYDGSLWVISSLTNLRNWDADDSSLMELGRVLGTMISDNPGTRFDVSAFSVSNLSSISSIDVDDASLFEFADALGWLVGGLGPGLPKEGQHWGKSVSDVVGEPESKAVSLLDGEVSAVSSVSVGFSFGADSAAFGELSSSGIGPSSSVLVDVSESSATSMISQEPDEKEVLGVGDPDSTEEVAVVQEPSTKSVGVIVGEVDSVVVEEV